MNMKFPVWIRAIVLISATMQLIFGITLFLDPAKIAQVWPWNMPPLTARVLGGSTLVSVPMAFIAMGVNRYIFAAIPLVMMATYRLLQLAAGIIHIDRFGANLPTAVNYFGGGLLMLCIFGYALWAGQNHRLPATDAKGWFSDPMPLEVPQPVRFIIVVLGILYVLLGLAFIALPQTAVTFWIDARGITPLTAKLFASPLVGLGLGLILISRAKDWRSVFVPSVGLVTIGVVVLAAIWLSREFFQPTTPVGWLVTATPVILFLVGYYLLTMKPGTWRQSSAL